MNPEEPITHENILDLEDLVTRKVVLEQKLQRLLQDKNLEGLAEFLDTPPGEVELDGGFRLGEWASAELDHAEGSELQALRELFDDIGTCSGRALIADSFFVKYAIQTFKDVEGVTDESAWPYSHINWRKAAVTMQNDYKPVLLGSEDYWVRS